MKLVVTMDEYVSSNTFSILSPRFPSVITDEGVSLSGKVPVSHGQTVLDEAASYLQVGHGKTARWSVDHGPVRSPLRAIQTVMA